jgi:S1-C subfamily serine protease
MIHRRAIAILFLLLAATSARADTLQLKDGTTLEGKVIPQGDRYWIKPSDGESRMIAKADVTQWTHGDSAESRGATGSTADFAATKSKADRLDVPLAAVALWQSFIDENAASPDLAAAKKEKALWQQRVDDHAEHIHGKWVSGDERKALLEKTNALMNDANRLMASHQTLQAVSKLQDILKLYPDHFAANFWLGLINLQQEKYDKAETNLATAVRLKPDSPEALTDYAIVLNFRKEYEKSVLTALKAAQIKDTREVVQNLVNSIAYAPPAMRTNNRKIQPAIAASNLLASKYNINKPGTWVFVAVHPDPAAPAEGGAPSDDRAAGPAGVIGNGSGFLVSSDGLILTNKHVAAEGDMLIVRLADGTQKQAERVVIDDEQDLALIRIKTDKPLPFLQLSTKDEPGPGAECTALGFPLGDGMRMTLQVTPGTVSSVIDADTANVVVTCKVNPGNSGGPLVDKFGNVIGIVTQKTFSGEFVESYGKAISAGRIRDFLKKTKDRSKADLKSAADGTTSLNTEAIYKKVSPAAVCIEILRTGSK